MRTTRYSMGEASVRAGGGVGLGRLADPAAAGGERAARRALPAAPRAGGEPARPRACQPLLRRTGCAAPPATACPGRPSTGPAAAPARRGDRRRGPAAGPARLGERRRAPAVDRGPGRGCAGAGLRPGAGARRAAPAAPAGRRRRATARAAHVRLRPLLPRPAPPHAAGRDRRAAGDGGRRPPRPAGRRPGAELAGLSRDVAVEPRLHDQPPVPPRRAPLRAARLHTRRAAGAGRLRRPGPGPRQPRTVLPPRAVGDPGARRMSEGHSDVLVVGGGPAGAACARLLAQAGLDVTVLDKAAFPRPKPCGEYTSPRVAAVLDR